MSEDWGVLDFAPAEYEARLARARDLMAAASVDALLLTTYPSLRYFTGHTSHRWMQPTAPMLAVVPQGGDPVLLLPAIELTRAADNPVVRDQRPIRGYEHIGVAELEATLRELGLAEGRIAAETGSLFRFGMPIDDYLAICEALPRARFVDASDIVWSLRMIKSDAEIACLQRSVAVTHRALARLYADIEPGMSEKRVSARFVEALMREGADWPGSIPIASRAPDSDHARDAHLRMATDRVVRAGDLVWLDAGCIVDGYWSDTMRMVSIGAATKAWKDAYRFVREACQACIAEVRPGAPASAAIAAYDRMLRASPYRDGAPNLRSARVAHGIGLDLIEPPSLSFDDPTVLAPGMVLTVEPSFRLPGLGFFMVEDQVVVTEAGVSILGEPAAAELPEIG